MTAVPAPRGAAAGRLARLTALGALELRLVLRTGLLAVAVGLTAAWTLILAVVPGPAARAAAPVLLFVDTATIGAMFVGALLLFERSDGAAQALATSPARPAERLVTRLLALTAVSVGAAVPIAVAGARGPSALLPAIAGVTLAALLVLVVTYRVALGQQTLTGFLTMIPWVLIPLLGVPLAYLVGLTRHPVLYGVPTTGPAAWIAAGFDPTGSDPTGSAAAWTPGWGWTFTYALAWIGGGVFASLRRHDANHEPGGTARAQRAHPAAGQAAGRAPAASAHPRRRRSPSLAAVWAFARADLRSVTRDSLLGIVVFAPVPLLLGLRFGYGPLERWAEQQHGLSLAPTRPVILGLLLVLQVPFIYGMLGALLTLDDAEERTLLAVRASPLTLERYLAYRVVAVTALALAGLAATVPLSGLVPAGSLLATVPALLVAALVAPLMLLLTTAVAGNRVEGVAAMKALGLVVHLPLVTWWLGGPWSWPLALIPSYWPLKAVWSSLDGRPTSVTVGTAALGVAASAAVGVGLWRRTVTRLTRS